MGSKKNVGNAIAIDQSEQFGEIPVSISDLPNDILLQSLHRDRYALQTNQCRAGIKALQDYLGMIEEGPLGSHSLLTADELQTLSLLASEGIQALTNYQARVEAELAVAEDEVEF